MSAHIVLASGSVIRAQLLQSAAVPFLIDQPRVDEAAIKQSMMAEGAPPRDIADTLAELKARRISTKTTGILVLGCDQVLEFKGRLISKPGTPSDAFEILQEMRGSEHTLLSAAVICEDGAPVWRHVGKVRLRMRDLSDDYLTEYVARNWDSIRHAVGAYKLEEEGVRLFSAVDGDYFNVLGMPLIELLSFLMSRGVIEQ